MENIVCICRCYNKYYSILFYSMLYLVPVLFEDNTQKVNGALWIYN